MSPSLTDVSAPVRRIVVPAGTSAAAAVRQAGMPIDGPEAVVVVRDARGGLRDLSWTPDADTEADPVAADTDDGRTAIRHSAALVLAQAVQQVFPHAVLGIGAPAEDGFYLDVALLGPVTADDLALLEQRMAQIIGAGQRFSRRTVGFAEAASEFAAEPYKRELLDLASSGQARVGSDVSVADLSALIGLGDELVVYDTVDTRSGERTGADLCQGPLVPTTGSIPAVKLLRSTNIHWRGNGTSAQMRRIHGTAWESEQALGAYLRALDEARLRDHRTLGPELDLFSFPPEVGAGLAVFHPRGGMVRQEIEAYSRRRHLAAGYDFVYTPHIAREVLIQTCGPLEWYRDYMYPAMHFDVESDEHGTVAAPGQDYYLKPMNCPLHNLVFRSRDRSHRELPLRMFEISTIYRYEPGPMHGLTTTRGMTHDDTHVFCTRDQLPDELAGLLRFVLGILRDFGLDDLHLELTTRNDEQFVGTDEGWAMATDALRAAADSVRLPMVTNPGHAEFYGPRIVVYATDALGRAWKISTVQVDFNLPDRFALEYTAPDGTHQRPMMIHRSLFGAVERFFGILTEHYAGAFPAWLAPVQVAAVPSSDEHVDHLRKVAEALRSEQVRVELDLSDGDASRKIDTHAAQLVPLLVLAGDSDVSAGTVSLRFRDGSQVDNVAVAWAVDSIVAWIARRENTSPTAASLQASV